MWYFLHTSPGRGTVPFSACTPILQFDAHLAWIGLLFRTVTRTASHCGNMRFIKSEVVTLTLRMKHESDPEERNHFHAVVDLARNTFRAYYCESYR